MTVMVIIGWFKRVCLCVYVTEERNRQTEIDREREIISVTN